MTTSNILFEIGLEEMPARFLNDAQQQLEQKSIEWLENLRLPYEEIQTFVTPRRLAILLKGVASKQPDQEEEARGPAKKIAQDEEGNWSKAAIGFTKGQGKSVDDIYFKEIKGTEYVFVNKYIKGQETEELLPGFKDTLLSLTFPKNMRWGELNIRYARPIRWIVALNDSKIIPMEIADVKSSNYSYGHRFLGEKIQLLDALDYEHTLKEQYVIANSAERKKRILEELKNIEQEMNWEIMIDDSLLDEVRHLVEYPTVFYGSFSEEFLTVPEEALITSMKEHQRYFPVRSKNGTLLPNFVAVRNGDDQFIETVAKGNEKVLRARLSDARFFYEEDQKQTIKQNLDKLKRMVFQEKLGTIADKVNRVVAISKEMTDLLHLSPEETKNVIRAAEICKFDLVTNMVNEFTELQGIMGEKYARLFGENKAVATAINEHYMPRHANDRLPNSTEGAIVSIADKLDTIIGCISVGILPSGSQDPYALRRQALGILQIINEKEWKINLESLFESTQSIIDNDDIKTINKEEVNQTVREFFKGRASYILKEENIDQDIIDAILASDLENFAFTLEKAKLLMEMKQDESFKDVQEAFVRVLNLASKGKDTGVDPNLFQNEYEKKLFESFNEVESKYGKVMEQGNAREAVNIVSHLSTPIHEFFDHTMVMVEDEKIKHNRLSLLNKIASMVFTFADLTKVQWKQQY
ncbi:glycine--tRNA ligase subunit beta [Aquibacillus albus]|uniref:Glycine--tRNA ligase beta subunit n=1 Tax=Aquibacillus albus TaxID=1168171 RepID=A0ABS2MUV7_9BACI|nr:glycine--tRNA ligase subunit beta [Aquibacillus albus]MBM7569635.1 glycyl-tRNA synthetase beta chain [Aquibacillus albus]